MSGLGPTWYTTQTSPIWTISLTTDSGVVVDLTGVASTSIVLLFKNTANGTETTGTGTVAITQVRPAIITYQPSSGDVASPGSFNIFAIVTFATGPGFYGPYAWNITQK